MEELKILVESIAGLPDLAIWVVGMYFMFKLAVVGSIYATIRFVMQKIHDTIIAKKRHVLTLDSDVITYDGTANKLKNFIQEVSGSNAYLHDYQLVKLREAWKQYTNK